MVATPTETEIKLVFEPSLRGEIERHPAFAGAAQTTPRRHELTTYFDTDDLLLHRHGYSLRIRKSNRHFVQTLKQVPEKSAAVHQRNEWEWNLNDNRLLLRPVQQMIAASGLDGEFHHPRPRVVTDIQRQSFKILREGCEIEAVIDEGTVKAGGREESIHEIELELKNGRSGPAFRLAMELLERHAFGLGWESKADRGYRLLTGCGTPPRKVRAAPIPQDAALGEALALGTTTALHGFVANLPAAHAGIPEGVHQARVALRRVRSVLVFYAHYLEPCARERYNNAIREIGAILGAARDWDVFIDEALPAAASAGVPADWVVALNDAADIQRKAAHAAVREKLESKAPAELILGLESWISEPAWATDSTKISRTPVRKLMPKLLDRLACKVEHRGRHLARRSANELHPLRKSLKKLRYSAENASELYRKKSVKRYVKSCKKLQTILGTINDAQVTTRLLTKIAPLDSAALGAAAGAMQKWNGERRAAVRSDLKTAWRKLNGTDPFWK